jgi:hypothetical protein
MYEEDYVKRLLRLLAQAVIRVLRLAKDEEYGAARAEIHHVLEELFGISESMILALGEEDVLDLIFRGGPADPECVALLADILRIGGDIAAAEGASDQALQWHQASLRYLVTATDKMGFQPNPETLRSFESLVQALSPASLSPELLASLYALYRGVGNHALASQLILAFTERTRHEAEGVREAQAYLAELSRMGDDALRQCGMTREGVSRMLAGLSARVT